MLRRLSGKICILQSSAATHGNRRAGQNVPYSLSSKLPRFRNQREKLQKPACIKTLQSKVNLRRMTTATARRGYFNQRKVEALAVRKLNAYRLAWKIACASDGGGTADVIFVTKCKNSRKEHAWQILVTLKHDRQTFAWCLEPPLCNNCASASTWPDTPDF